MKATAQAHSNIAFIKYWGKKEGFDSLKLPANGSISMNLSNLVTETTVEFSERYSVDKLDFNGTENNDNIRSKVSEHLDRVRKKAGVTTKAKVVSRNNFPHSSGLSSSASGFAALTVAAVSALELQLNEKELSLLARQGSGSACRSIPTGFVEWVAGRSHDSSYAYSIFPPDHWDLIDVVVVIDAQAKELSSTEGMSRAFKSPFYKERLKNIQEKIHTCTEAIRKKDFEIFGELIESEALEMHSIAFTSHPPMIYWAPETLRLMLETQRWRKAGLPVYFTINTGHDIHLITTPDHEKKLVSLIHKSCTVKKIIMNHPSEGACITKNHLF